MLFWQIQFLEWNHMLSGMLKQMMGEIKLGLDLNDTLKLF